MAELEVKSFARFMVAGQEMAAVTRIFYHEDGDVRVVWERFECDAEWVRYPPTF